MSCDFPFDTTHPLKVLSSFNSTIPGTKHIHLWRTHGKAHFSTLQHLKGSLRHVTLTTGLHLCSSVSGALETKSPVPTV